MARLRELGVKSVRPLEGVQENMAFPLPKGLAVRRPQANVVQRRNKMDRNSSYNQNISFGPGNLFDSFRFKLEELHLSESDGKLRPDPDYRNKIDISNTNFAQLYPEVAKNMKDIDRLYFRPQQYNQREWFDNLLHWFTPKGRDVMEVYATDSTTSEKTQIKSFDDYLAWREAYPEEVKKYEK